RDFIGRGFRAVVVCLDPGKLDETFAGREFDESFLENLPSDVDPCGENGEFHTFVYEAPIFEKRIEFDIGETVERDGFVFTDLIPSPGEESRTRSADS
ncbi:MAG: hypothetical protein M3494_00005, partial [Actinomycetota bacterium]|nr:hypothetical protein [Actinomycetota bacterium]